MTRLSDAIIDAFQKDMGNKLDWLPEIEGDIDETPTKFGDEKTTRKHLRLLVNATIQAYLDSKDDNSYRVGQYSDAMETLGPINSQRKASRAANRLMQVSEWAEYDLGGSGDRYYSASRLCEILMEHYSGWPMMETHEEAASLFAGAVGRLATAQPAVLKVLGELKKLEGTP